MIERVPLIPEYPNISTLLESMPDGMQQIGCMYMGLLPAESLQQIDANLPTLEQLSEQGDDAGITALLMAFGLDRQFAEQLTALQHAADKE